MNAVVIFDVSTRQEEVISAMLRNGYYRAWVNNNKTINLPSNSVWKPNIELQQGHTDITSVIQQINIGGGTQIILLRCLVLNNSPWYASLGTPV